MTTHYLEIQLLQDPEFPVQLLMDALFSKLHRVFVAIKNENIGISFPDVEQNCTNGLGKRIRLHGTTQQIEELQRHSWLMGMRDNVKISDILPIPAEVTHRSIKRVQANSNVDRIRRRQMTRKGITAAEAEKTIPEKVVKRLSLPFISLTSQSTQQKFFLFIEHCPKQTIPNGGSFSCYGLSSSATVPWWP